ncbi:MAG: hypothetical protein KDA37_03300, partial [Planctomycetales bacterium]|nr:hypothetical protein [Planctomycetales bacterium]
DLRFTQIVDVPITLVTGSDGALHRPNDWFGLAESYVRNNYGFEPEDFNVNIFDVSATPQDIGQGWAGIAVSPGNNIAVQSGLGDGFRRIVVDHELGHRFGAPHSGAWRVTNDGNYTPYVWDAKRGEYTVYNAGKHGLTPSPYGVHLDEYGDPFSVMGNISHDQFSVHQKRTNLHWITDAQVPDLDQTGEGVYRVHAHDQLQAIYNEPIDLMGVEDGYSADKYYGLRFDKNSEVYSIGAGVFESKLEVITLEYRRDEGLLFYQDQIGRALGVLDLDLEGGDDRNNRARGLQVGDRIEDIVFATSYAVGGGTNDDFLNSNPPAPSEPWEIRPQWYEFRVLTAGADAFGEFLDIGVEVVTYVPRGDLNDDGFFDQFDVEEFIQNWLTDTSDLNSIAQQMHGDLNNSGFVDIHDAYLLRRILFDNGVVAAADFTYSLVPEPGCLALWTAAMTVLVGARTARRRAPA